MVEWWVVGLDAPGENETGMFHDGEAELGAWWLRPFGRSGQI